MSKPMGDKHYTYADYVTWTGDERWELIDGVPYMMSSPHSNHQRIVTRLAGRLDATVQEKCEAFASPMDLTFDVSQETDRVVQPDVFVMCGEYEAGPRVVGVPVLVIEVLSPSTFKRDKMIKFNLYQNVGVKEYWVVDIEHRGIDVFVLEDGRYQHKGVYNNDDILKCASLPEFQISVTEIFERVNHDQV